MNNKYLALAALTLTTSICALSALQDLGSRIGDATGKVMAQTSQALKQMENLSVQAVCKECGKKPEVRNPLITEEICNSWTKETCEHAGFPFGE